MSMRREVHKLIVGTGFVELWAVLLPGEKADDDYSQTTLKDNCFIALKNETQVYSKSI